MKKLIICVGIILLSVIRLLSQEYIRRLEVEMNGVLDGNRTYQCEATKEIKLKPGFYYEPTAKNEMGLVIDRYSVYPPIGGDYGAGSSSVDDFGMESDCVVGSLPATFNVDNIGAAVYSIDLALPRAVGAMMPQLSIVYKNQSGNGMMGWSWDISGLSAISRVGQTEYHDGKVTSVDFTNDRFVVDGKRLIALNNAMYGAEGTVYKTEFDNMDKVVSYVDGYKGPKRFVVWKNDGLIWEYGASEDSRLESNTANKTVLKWLLSRIADRDGNSILFHYDINNKTGESYVNNIEYTVNEDAGLKAAYKIVFKYDENRLDPWSGYVAGMSVSCKRLLKNIHVIKNDTERVLFDYSFEYNAPAYYGDHYFLHYRLKSIGLAVGDKKINSTKIKWNDEKKHYPQSQGFNIYKLDKTLFTEVPFVGDFNGDGLSDVFTVPYKIQDTYTSDIKGKVYLNNGNGTFNNVAMTTITLPQNLDWVYVMDMNDDGKDDIITYEYNYDYELGDDVLVTLNMYLQQNGTFVKKKTYSYNDNVSIIPGKFLSNDKQGLIIIVNDVDERLAYYISCVYGTFTKNPIGNLTLQNESDFEHMALDMTGDGVTELFSMGQKGCYINRLVHDSWGYRFVNYIYSTSFNKDSYTFPNDFNGDGKTDILYYDGRTNWNIVFSRGNAFSSPMSCVNTNLLRFVTLNTKDRYRCSLKEMAEPTVAIRTADFDGDGLSDVGVFTNKGGNYYLQIGFMPYVKDDNTCDFKYMKRYHMPINYSHQTIHIGRFLPQENVTFISSLSRKPYATENPYLVAIYPHSAMYSVERITDGLGNARGFCYDFLIPKSNTDFYTSDNGCIEHDMKRISLPLQALKNDTIYNVNGKPIITKYEYNNAVFHTKGHGFLAFEKTIIRTFVNGNCVSKQIQETEPNTMGANCALLPKSLRLYYGEDQLVKEVLPKYKKYSCKTNPKVVIPVLIENCEIEYDYNKHGQVLKSVISKYDYQSDINSDNFYGRVLPLVKTTNGYNNDKLCNDAYSCPYWEEEILGYNNNFKEWIVNRVAQRKKVFGGVNETSLGSVETYSYNDNNSLKVSTITKVPNINNDKSDSLTLTVEYEYDKFGHKVQQAISSPSLKYKKILKYEYGDKYQYRYQTKSINEIGDVISCEYDDDYGMLTKTIDYNQFETTSVKDPLGIDDILQLPDGIQQVKSLRWSHGNEYAPKNSSYYCWEKSSGNAEKMIFYHKNGTELRSVTFDIKGEPIIKDISYDDFGNIISETLPYNADGEKILMSMQYDKYNRIVKTLYPNGLTYDVSYNGNKVVTNMIAKNGVTKTKVDDFNVRGWLVNTTDVGGNKIEYEYYSDGLMKSAQINSNDNTKITVKYDNNGNRSCLIDPNYGTITYVNDALGNIIKVVSSNGNVVEYEYDVLGRKIRMNEFDKKLNNKTTTQWIYEDQDGKRGVLKKVYNGIHSTEYFYDDQLRVANTIETVNGKKYNTSYTYDKANRISTITYPTGLTLLRTYSNSGYDLACQNKGDETLLWKTVKTNSLGCITEFQLGNGMRTLYSYDPYTSMINNIYTSKEDNVVQNDMYEYDDFGNMTSRSKNVGKYRKETFEYDEYDRLIGTSLNGKKIGEMQYDNKGNIVYKNAEGVDVLYETVYDNKRPYNIIKTKTDAAETFPYLKQNIKYSVFDNVARVESDDKLLDIGYGCDRNRIFMNVDKEGCEYSKVYVSNSEFIVKDGVSSMLTYLVGPMGVFGVYCVDEDGDESVYYVHKDNVESWNVITDEDGEKMQELSFDAWGNMRDYDDWYGDPTNDEIMFDRGYTGHEHLNDFGLINMNGRMYDPMMSMMISPDNNIQMPHMSQNFNRYSYCLNNPLKYNDPTGEWVESVVLGIAFGASNVVFNADKIDTFAEGMLLFGVGFVQGFLTEYTMGQSWYVQVGANTLTGALKSGVNEFVSIGDGSFEMTGDDWNAVARSAYYGLGSSLTKSIFNSYIHAPSYDDRGYKLQYLFFGNEEVAHAVTSFMAHGVGCWFSGQPMLSSMTFGDVGIDLEMLSIVANRLLASYVYKSDFAKNVVEQRSKEIKDRMLSDILSENPDHGDIEMFSELSYVDVSGGVIYISGDIVAKLPGELFKVYPNAWAKAFPKPYLDEVVSFPFSYSLFKTLFFGK